MSHEHVLLVEGINDLHAIRNLVYKHDVSVHYENDEHGPDLESSAFQIKRVCEDEESGGESKFTRSIETHLRLDDVRTLGVVADGDDDYTARWEARINDLYSFEKDRVFTSLEELDTDGGWVGKTQNQIGSCSRRDLDYARQRITRSA